VSDHSSQETDVHNHLKSPGISRGEQSVGQYHDEQHILHRQDVDENSSGVLSRREKRTITDGNPAPRQLFNSQEWDNRKPQGAKWNGKHTHPLYSPDLACSSCFLFPLVKKRVDQFECDYPGDLPETITEILGSR
jgi:hypothetical protein